ncbi:MAG TPA: hypothetical protein VGY56_13105 [Verrucomicrobiae bacterium]|nr:hypothetical protein [Verrucomicrobiae bacterium]
MPGGIGKRARLAASSIEKLRLITVLGKRPVDSPARAVRAAIFYDVQPAPMRDPDS